MGAGHSAGQWLRRPTLPQLPEIAFLGQLSARDPINENEVNTMAWIRTVPLENADESLLKAMADQRSALSS